LQYSLQAARPETFGYTLVLGIDTMLVLVSERCDAITATRWEGSWQIQPTWTA